MEWSDENDEDFETLMQDFPQMLPALERAVRFEDEITDIQRRLDVLEGRNPLLEAVKNRFKGETNGN